MKIEEVINLYDFLATCGWPGAIALWLSLTLLIAAAALWGKDKLDLSIKTPRWIVFSLTAVIVFTVLFFFKRDADGRKEILKKANCIKSEFVTYGWKVASYATMLDSSFHCPCVQADLDNVRTEHPSEFIEVKVDDGFSKGIRIIDANALAVINNYNREHSPFIKSRILDYMDTRHLDSLSYSSVREEINSDFDDEWIEIMLSKYDSVFIPTNTMQENVLYGKSHFVKRKKKKSRQPVTKIIGASRKSEDHIKELP